MMKFDGRRPRVEEIAPLALTNYGHFTSMLVEGLSVRGLTLHLDRLERDARILFDVALDVGNVRHLVRDALQGLDQPVVARVTVFDPNIDLGHPSEASSPRMLITTRPVPATAPSPMRLRSVVYRRDAPEVKHVGLFGALQHRRIAQREGYDDVVFVDEQSRVSEIATSNVGFYDGARIIWPKASVLPGVTWALLEKAHEGPMLEAPVGLAGLPDMKAAFATNAVVGVRPIASIDKASWDPSHPIIGRLQQEYRDILAEAL